MGTLDRKFSDVLRQAIGHLDESESPVIPAPLGTRIDAFSTLPLWQLHCPEPSLERKSRFPYVQKNHSSTRPKRFSNAKRTVLPEPRIALSSLTKEVQQAVARVFHFAKRPLPRDLTRSEFKKLYRALAQIYHPDKIGQDNSHLFKEIAAAYQAAAPSFPKSESVG